MGYSNARDMAEYADLETALHWHLQANHFPPIPTIMVAPCKRAIELAVEGNYDGEIDLPEGVQYRGASTCTAAALVEHAHLRAFIEAELEKETP